MKFGWKQSSIAQVKCRQPIFCFFFRLIIIFTTYDLLEHQTLYGTLGARIRVALFNGSTYFWLPCRYPSNAVFHTYSYMNKIVKNIRQYFVGVDKNASSIFRQIWESYEIIYFCKIAHWSTDGSGWWIRNILPGSPTGSTRTSMKRLLHRNLLSLKKKENGGFERCDFPLLLEVWLSSCVGRVETISIDFIPLVLVYVIIITILLASR